jgi:hypothetical protein
MLLEWVGHLAAPSANGDVLLALQHLVHSQLGDGLGFASEAIQKARHTQFLLIAYKLLISGP